MKLYQPHRKDLLINTDWGISKDVISEETARNKIPRLELFKGRWVTEDEKRILKAENNTYSWIRGIGHLLIFSSVLLTILLFIWSNEVIERLGEPVWILISAVVNIITAIGLYQYKQWARWVATVILALSVLTGLGLLIAPFALYYLHNITARQIFSKQIISEPEIRERDGVSYCPQCKSKYREGFTVCSDCGVKLVRYNEPLTKE